MSDAGPSLKLPAPFGKYLLTNLIAVGGMAEVYRAKIFGASGFEKDMVVKRILPRFAQNPSFVQMLIDEAKIAVSLSHGNIVPIYELGELDGGYYIAMEFVEGRTILDILRDAHSKKAPSAWGHWDVAEMRLVYEAGPIPVPSTLTPSIPPDVDEVVMKALAPKVEDRYQSASDFEEALRTAIAKGGIAVTSSGLARTLQAIDDAPGPRAPRTQPHAGDATAPMSSQASQALASGQGAQVSLSSVAAAPSPSPVSLLANGATAARPLPPRSPTPSASAALSPGDGPPKTQPMPAPKPPAVIDAPHSFVISLAEPPGGAPTRAPEPLPVPRGDVGANHPRTQVLAMNEGLAWSQNIGDDAEIIAIARAMGTAPGQGRRAALVLAGLAVVGLVVGGVVFGDEVRGMIARAMSGQSQNLGAIIVKLRPSPEDIILDGKSRGGGNKKITNVDLDVAHRLVVKPKGMEPIVLELAPADFKDDDGGRTYTMERDLTAPPPGTAPTPPATPPK